IMNNHPISKTQNVKIPAIAKILCFTFICMIENDVQDDMEHDIAYNNPICTLFVSFFKCTQKGEAMIPNVKRKSKDVMKNREKWKMESHVFSFGGVITSASSSSSLLRSKNLS